MLLLKRNMGESVMIDDSLRLVVTAGRDGKATFALYPVGEGTTLDGEIDDRIQVADGISFVVIEAQNDVVKIGVDAPRHVAVYREELYWRVKAEESSRKPVEIPTLRKPIPIKEAMARYFEWRDTCNWRSEPPTFAYWMWVATTTGTDGQQSIPFEKFEAEWNQTYAIDEN